ncbi:hypothetical protein Tco_0736868 [Tanacetum coccineum]
MFFSRGRVRGVICKLCSSNVDEDTTSRLWLQLQQNTVVLRLSVSHSNIMQPRTTLTDKAHPYSISFHKGTGRKKEKPGSYICCQNHKLIADIENDIMDPVMQCTTLPSHSGFSQQKLVSFVMKIHTLSIDISLRDSVTPRVIRNISMMFARTFPGGGWYTLVFTMTNGNPSVSSKQHCGKSISLTEAEEVEAARKVHATHARIVTETVPKLDRRRPSGKVTSDPSKKLKSVISLNPKE